MNIPIVIALIGYVVLMTIVSVYWTIKIKDTEGFLMAGRSLGLLPLMGTLVATAIGTGATIGAAGLAYRSGWGGSIYSIGIGAGIIFVGLVFSNTRRYRFMTLGEEVACYYGGNKVIYHLANMGIFFSSIYLLVRCATYGRRSYYKCCYWYSSDDKYHNCCIPYCSCDGFRGTLNRGLH